MSDDILVRLRGALDGCYRIERQVGQGGMAMVYLARDLEHDRDVAIKVLSPDLIAPGSTERFLREIRIGAQLQHPHILPLFDSGAADGLLYYVMPFVSGESLRDRLRRERALPIDDALRIASDVASALTYAHTRGVIHRDIKPDNIMLSGEHALVADFGIARAIDAADQGQLTETGIAVGTVAYMSPEQAAGEKGIDARSDIYALGCVVYEMLGGEPPFTGPTMQAVIARHLSQPPPSLRIVRSTVPDHVQAAVERALAKTPADRFQTAQEFAKALHGEGTRAAMPSASPPVGMARARSRTLARAVAATAALATVTVGAWWAWNARPRAGSLDPNLLAIAPFNVLRTDLALWGEGLVDVLARALHGAGPLRVVAPSTVVRGWQGRPDLESAVALGERTGAGIAVFGILTPLGSDSVRLQATPVNVSTRQPLGEEILVDGRADRLGFLADSLAIAVLRTVGRNWPVAAVRQASLQATSLPALRAYLQGEQHFRRTLWDSAQAAYERASADDSTFALAVHRLYLVRMLRGSGQDSLVWQTALRAGARNRHLAPRESLLVVADSLLAALMLRQGVSDSLIYTQRQRLFATLDVSTRRFPDDPQVWYQFGLAHSRLGAGARASNEEILRAFERSIALDSAFAPSYVKAINLAMRLRGEAEARRFIKAYLALDPPGTQGDAIRLSARLMDARGEPSAELDQVLDTASALLIFRTIQPLAYWFDDHETLLQLSQLLADGSRDVSALSSFARYGVYLHSLLLGWRGHAAEAYGLRRRSLNEAISQVWALGGVPTDSVAALMRLRIGGPHTFGAGLLEWLAAAFVARDTLILRQLKAGGDSVVTRDPQVLVRAQGTYLRDGADAYLALLRGDSATAERLLTALPDSLCGCYMDRLNRVRLLAARGKDAEAAALLKDDLPDAALFIDGLWRLERGRVAERLGRREAAIEAYRYVVNLWANGDASLEGFVREAREALQRLGARDLGRRRTATKARS